MADKGKRVMSAEELRLEQEAQESRRIQELVDSWLAMQEVDPKPPTPIQARFPSYPPGFTPKTPEVGSSNPIPPAPGSPTYTPSQVATNWVTQKALNDYWARRGPPEGLGPWYRMNGGFIRFRFGTPWVMIDREERIAAQERADARARGIPVPEQPPPKQDDEHILQLRRMLVPAPSSSEEEEEEEEDFDPGEDSSSDEGENQNQDQAAWSDTSTVTDEPTQVPASLGGHIKKSFFGRLGRGRNR